MNLTETQQQILNCKKGKIVVMSSAASGKTTLLTEKTRQILQSGIDPREIAVITFTNMAAGELTKRLSFDYKEGIFIGTIHSLANSMLRAGGVDTSSVLNEEQFDKLFYLIKTNPHCVKHLKWVLLDEAQDSDQAQFDFIFKYIAPENFFVIGDMKQSIYRWKGAEPELLEDLANRPDVVTFSMLENFRNRKNILDFAKDMIYQIKLIDNSRPVRPGSGIAQRMAYNPTTIINLIKEYPIYSEWAILCRTNADVEKITTLLKENHIPNDTFRQGDLTLNQMIEKMCTNTVKVLTIHSAKGLEWDNVIVVDARYYSIEEYCINYVAATRAKDILIWMYYPKKGKRR